MDWNEFLYRRIRPKSWHITTIIIEYLTSHGILLFIHVHMCHNVVGVMRMEEVEDTHLRGGGKGG
jgi:hypothetical protein